MSHYPPMIPRIILPILLALALCMPGVANARYGGRGGGRGKSKIDTNIHTTISAISADSITVKTPDGTQTYKIGSGMGGTQITYQGQTVTTDALKVGMRVEVTPDGAEADVASVIAADDAPVAPAGKKKK